MRLTLPALCSLCLAAPVSALAETCEEVHESCLETCHIDFGMEAQRVELGKCAERCDRRLEDCGDVRQEEKRNQFKVADPDAEKRRGDPVDVYRYDENKTSDVKPAKYEDFDDGDRKPKADKPKPKKADPDDDSPPAKVDRPKKAEPDADDPPPKKKPEEPRKKKDQPKDKKLSDDDWAK